MNNNQSYDLSDNTGDLYVSNDVAKDEVVSFNSEDVKNQIIIDGEALNSSIAKYSKSDENIYIDLRLKQEGLLPYAHNTISKDKLTLEEIKNMVANSKSIEEKLLESSTSKSSAKITFEIREKVKETSLVNTTSSGDNEDPYEDVGYGFL